MSSSELRLTVWCWSSPGPTQHSDGRGHVKAPGLRTHSNNSLPGSLSSGSGVPVMRTRRDSRRKEKMNEWWMEQKLYWWFYLQKKSPNPHICQSVKASKELIEGSDQILGWQVHGQQSEALDVCKKDAAKKRERELWLRWYPNKTHIQIMREIPIDTEFTDCIL